MSAAETDTLVLYCALANSLHDESSNEEFLWNESRTKSSAADDGQRARATTSSSTDALHREKAALAASSATLPPRSQLVGWWARLVNLLCPLTVDSTDDLAQVTKRLREADLALDDAAAATVAATREFWCGEVLELNDEEHTPAPPKEPIAIGEKRSDAAAKRQLKLTLDVAARSASSIQRSATWPEERRDWMDAALKGLLGGEVPRKMSGMHLATFEQR